MAQQTAEWIVDLSNPNADKITSDSTTNVSISNKQSMTAVEWLHSELTKTWYDVKSSQGLLEQAKQLEKKQIIKAFNDLNDDISAEQYYNENYNK